MTRRGAAIALLFVVTVVGVLWAAKQFEFAPPGVRPREAQGVLPAMTVKTAVTVEVPKPRDGGAVLSQALPPPGTPLVEIYGELKLRVAQGDHRAACRIGYELDRCKRLPVARHAPNSLRRTLADPAFPAARRADLEKNLEMLEQRLRESEVVCADAPESEFPKAWDYFLASALAGNGYAAWKISRFPPGLEFIHREETLEGWIQWRQHIPSLTEEGLRRGDPRMVALASSDSYTPREGMWVRPKDPVKAVGYHMALLNAASDAYRPTIQRDTESLIKRLKLTAQQVDEARAFAVTVKVNVPPGGIDWTQGQDADASGMQCEQG